MKIGEQSKLPTSFCSACGQVASAASGLEGDHRPAPGDFSLCIHCAALNVFDADMRLRSPTEQERADAETIPSLEEAREAIFEANKRAVHTITEMWAWISVHDDGNEGIVAADIVGGVFMPLIGSEKARIESLEPIAQRAAEIAKLAGGVRSLKLVRLHNVEVIREIPLGKAN